MKKIKNIIWDWNGTILDDIDICINSMNIVLSKYNLKKIRNPEHYQQLFCFPIKQYYENLGIDFTQIDFSIVVKEFMEIYQPESNKIQLIENVKNVIEYFNSEDINQIVLSASKKENLLEQVENYKLTECFKNIIGIDNIFAASKLELAKEWIEKNNIDLKETIIIGDTKHDFEISNELGIRCYLYTKGHQKNIKNTEYKIFDDYTELLEKIKKENEQ